MSNDGQGNNIKGQIVAGIITVVTTLIIGGTVPWWWQEVKPKSSEPKPPEADTTQSQPPVEPETTRSQPPVIPKTSPETKPPIEEVTRVAINIAYTGDYFACSLPVSIAIGDQQFNPHGNLFQASGIQTGQQKYQINGQIVCPSIGNCQVYGEGFINVIPNNTYYIGWQNTAFGQCVASLR